MSKITDLHNLDFEQLIRKYDADDTFFYLDPPYFSPEYGTSEANIRTIITD
jgi:site-specific DNA-adenine methylase